MHSETCRAATSHKASFVVSSAATHLPVLDKPISGAKAGKVPTNLPVGSHCCMRVRNSGSLGYIFSACDALIVSQPPLPQCILPSQVSLFIKCAKISSQALHSSAL